MSQEEKWVTMKDICEHLGVSRDTVKKMVNTQGLPGVKLDRQWKFKKSEVDAWMREHYKSIGQ